jgi:DNA-binding transcriptional LysR family regulator
VSQPVVSAHLRSLQERLGATLFDRDGRGIRLTEAGEAAYAWAKDVLTRRAELAHEIHDLSSGSAGAAAVAASLSVGNYLLPPVLSDFAAANPRARITLTISDPETALGSVESGQADFAVVMTDGQFNAAVFAAEQVAEQESVLVASANDDGVPARVSVADLERLPAVCPPHGLTIRRMQDEALRAVGVRQRPVAIEMGSAEAIKHAVAAGLGVALLARASVAEEIAAGRLREVPVEGVRISQPVYLVKRESKRLTPLQRALADAIRARHVPET